MFLIGLYIVIAALLTTVVWRVVSAYRDANGTGWQRFMLVFRNSETILFARVTQAVGAVISGMSYLADFANMPEVTSLVHTIFTDAKQAAIYGLSVLGIGFVTEKVRMHRTQPQPDGSIVAPPPQPKN